jgi:hypothetical protein
MLTHVTGFFELTVANSSAVAHHHHRAFIRSQRSAHPAPSIRYNIIGTIVSAKSFPKTKSRKGVIFSLFSNQPSRKWAIWHLKKRKIHWTGSKNVFLRQIGWYGVCKIHNIMLIIRRGQFTFVTSSYQKLAPKKPIFFFYIETYKFFLLKLYFKTKQKIYDSILEDSMIFLDTLPLRFFEK